MSNVCLKCQNKFKATSPFNRICPRCTTLNESSPGIREIGIAASRVHGLSENGQRRSLTTPVMKVLG